MYQIVKEFKEVHIECGLPQPFKGKNVIVLADANQEELKHIYEVVGNRTHVEKIAKKPNAKPRSKAKY